MTTPDEPEPLSPREFDRKMDAKVLAWGRRRDASCPQCGELGYRLIADSEFVALYACRLCGYQREEPHEPRDQVERPFREYREGRGLIAGYEDGAGGTPE